MHACEKLKEKLVELQQINIMFYVFQLSSIKLWYWVARNEIFGIG